MGFPIWGLQCYHIHVKVICCNAYLPPSQPSITLRTLQRAVARNAAHPTLPSEPSGIPLPLRPADRNARLPQVLARGTTPPLHPGAGDLDHLRLRKGESTPALQAGKELSHTYCVPPKYFLYFTESLNCMYVPCV